MSFVSSKPDPYPTPVDVVVYLISAIMNRVIKRFYCMSATLMHARLAEISVLAKDMPLVLAPNHSPNPMAPTLCIRFSLSEYLWFKNGILDEWLFTACEQGLDQWWKTLSMYQLVSSAATMLIWDNRKQTLYTYTLPSSSSAVARGASFGACSSSPNSLSPHP